MARRYITHEGRFVPRAVAIVEKILGKRLPHGAIVHHSDGNLENDSPFNFVVCPSKSYHNLLHARMDAFAATGNPESRRCQYCKQWGVPDSFWTLISKGGRKAWHKKCRADYELTRYYVRKNG